MLGWELPPYNSGGLGMASYQICRSLAKKNIDIEFILPYKAEHNIDFMKVFPALPGGVIEVQHLGVAYDSYKYIFSDNGEDTYSDDLFSQVRLYQKAALKLIANKSFDILHAHDWLTFSAAIKIKELRNCPIVLHVHSVESDRSGNNPGNSLIREIEEVALNMADRIIAVSEFTKNKIIQDYRIPEQFIEVVHNSINANELIDLDPENSYNYLRYMKSKGYRVITNVGRLTVQKGLSGLLHAIQKVVAIYPKTILLIVGSGDQMNELLNLSAELGIAKNIIFTDFQRGKNWRNALGIGDLFVMPSVSEPFGLTPLEAISYHTPALISKQSGVSEVLNNVLKVDFWDIDEMANQITTAFSNQVLLDELLRNSYQEVLRMSWDHVGNKISKIYNEINNTQVAYV